jgi:hypothetical protein
MLETPKFKNPIVEVQNSKYLTWVLAILDQVLQYPKCTYLGHAGCIEFVHVGKYIKFLRNDIWNQVLRCLKCLMKLIIGYKYDNGLIV